MAYDYTKFQRWSDGVALNGANQWSYKDTSTAIATIVASGFFNHVNNTNPSHVMQIGDLIWIVASDALDGEFAVVTAVSPNITVSVFDAVLGVGAVGTNNIAALAVTGAKMANNTITDTQVSANGLTSAALDKTTVQYVKVPMTAAQWAGMYAAGFEIIPAPGANKLVVVRGAILGMTFVAAQYTAGGATGLQYGTTAHLAGPLASATVAGATIDAYAASSDVGVAGADTSGASSGKVNKSICISNDTAAFATGDGTWNVHVWYEVVTL